MLVALPVLFLEQNETFIEQIQDDILGLSQEGEDMTYEEAKIYINFIKVLLEKEDLLEDKLLEALNTALQALDYELISVFLPTDLPTNLLKGRKIALFRD